MSHTPSRPANVCSAEPATPRARRRPRRDAEANRERVLAAAAAAMTREGHHVPLAAIAAAAGVGVGTLYRHFPRRADLVLAVFRREVEDCADAASTLASENPPGVALEKWLYRLTEFIVAKRGLAAALHSGDPAFDGLPAYFMGRFGPALEDLLDAATASGEIRVTITAEELMYAVATLCHPPVGEPSVDQSWRMVAILVNGLRFEAARSSG